MDKEADVGARIVARCIASCHSDVYVSVDQEYSLGLVGSMGEVEAATMWQDAQLLDGQCKTTLNH